MYDWQVPQNISKNHTSVNIAPGEGQVPKDIMTDEDWDSKAFPHLHNPDGTNGKDQDWTVRLTDQNYFIHRICNKEKRFAKSAAYMYAAVAYIEKNQINRNINLAGTRGKQVVNNDLTLKEAVVCEMCDFDAISIGFIWACENATCAYVSSLW